MDMDFKDSLKQLSNKIEKLKENLLTEEATKTALVLPFLTALGYDVFNPLEIVPELDCDLVKKKGEKIDYAIMKDGEPIILIECKHWQENLDLHDTQLQKYFVASKAKFGVLTNGIIYRFYTDIEKQNVMDEKPFLEINLSDIKDTEIEELKKFHKSYFDFDAIVNSASELKYMHELKNAISAELSEPSEDFVKHFGKQVYDGVFTTKLLEEFTPLVKNAAMSYINDLIQDRLKAAIANNAKDTENEVEPESQKSLPEENKIITTEEELESFYIIKSILHSSISPERITYRDSLTYFAIFVDNNNRKTICRLYLNSPNSKSIVFLDENKKEIRHKISSIDEIYNYQQELQDAALKYL